MKILNALCLATLSMLMGCSTPSLHIDEKSSVADELNTRYMDTSETCSDGSAAFHCNGVLVRVSDTLISSKDELDKNTVAFSYMRADARVTELYKRGTQGIILSALPIATTNALSVRCAFATNAQTDSRPDGCGMTTRVIQGLEFEWSRHCDEQGINDEDSWYLHYKKIRYHEAYMCALRPTAYQFALSIKARKLMLQDFTTPWNEVVTSAWNVADLKTLPFQAFFFNPQAPQNLVAAQKLQRDFYTYTGIILPIVRLDLAAQDRPVFVYSKDDQLLLPTH
ncbi:hypothetical protein [Pseudomonas fildesensis]|nr:hypothetical protein [Pseudomonas fildesensis]